MGVHIIPTVTQKNSISGNIVRLSLLLILLSVELYLMLNIWLQPQDHDIAELSFKLNTEHVCATAISARWWPVWAFTLLALLVATAGLVSVVFVARRPSSDRVALMTLTTVGLVLVIQLVVGTTMQKFTRLSSGCRVEENVQNWVFVGLKIAQICVVLLASLTIIRFSEPAKSR